MLLCSGWLVGFYGISNILGYLIPNSVWPMEAWDFGRSRSGFLGDKFFSLSLTVLYEQIGDLCKGCFVRDFALLREVRVGVVDPMCILLGLPQWISFYS